MGLCACAWLTADYDTQPKGLRLRLKGEHFHVISHELLRNGIFNAEGDVWIRQRKTASYEFASKVLRDYGCDNFKAHAVSLCRILDQASKDERLVDMMVFTLFWRSLCYC
ncbi:hypothetical protein R1sor_019432 [Riccia sorocarpa]|uniref:Cytochrome P450 n=1 Tax=Riccia sorocarpa TaxID=122646 RepID=A0ABD3IG50_9MARC